MKLKTSFLSLSAFTLLASALPQTSTAYGEDIQLSACPPIVQATIQQYQRDGKLEEVEANTAEGQTWYVADVELAGDRDLKIHVRSDGSLIKTSEKIALTDVPDAVQASVNQAVATGKVDEVHRVTANGVTTYKIEIDRSGADDLKLEVAEDGAVISQKKD